MFQPGSYRDYVHCSFEFSNAPVARRSSSLCPFHFINLNEILQVLFAATSCSVLFYLMDKRALVAVLHPESRIDSIFFTFTSSGSYIDLNILDCFPENLDSTILLLGSGLRSMSGHRRKMNEPKLDLLFP